MGPLLLAAAALPSLVQGATGLLAGNKNRKLAYRQAREEEITGVAERSLQREQARKAIGAQLASQYSGGMLGGTGSALDAIRESQVNAALDAMTLRRDRTLRAQSIREGGDQARTAGRFAAVNGLLGAGASVINKNTDWAQARNR